MNAFNGGNTMINWTYDQYKSQAQERQHLAEAQRRNEALKREAEAQRREERAKKNDNL